MANLPAQVFEAFRTHRLVAVIRAADSQAALSAARAVIRGGIALVELTYSVPDAPAVVRELVRLSLGGVAQLLTLASSSAPARCSPAAKHTRHSTPAHDS